MNRELALRILLLVVGLVFSAGGYPLITALWQRNQSEFVPMLLSLYVTLGIFLLLAARAPSGNRSLIAFTAWSSFAHAAVMTVQAFQQAGSDPDLPLGVAALVVIGVALIVLAPARQSAEPVSAARA